MPLSSDAPNILDEVMSQRPAGQAQAAQEANLQQAMRVAKQPGADVQKLATTLASAQGQENIRQTQAVMQEQSTKAATSLDIQQRKAKAQAQSQDIAYQKLAEQNANAVAELGSEAEKRVNQDTRRFYLDEAQRKYMNNDMLDHYTVEKQLNQQQVQDYMQRSQMLYQRKAMLYDVYARQLEQVINQGYIREKNDLDNKSKEVITKIHAQYLLDKENALKDEKARAAKASMMVGVFTVVGTVAGAVVGTMMMGGATIPGAAIGGALGTAVGTVFEG